MSDSRLYIRSRGKIMGPFSLQQMQALRSRGQLSRFHEVSEDRISWVAASSLTELFPPSQPAGRESGATPSGSGSSPAGWYYRTAEGQQCGPISLQQLEGYRDEGFIDDDTLVRPAGRSDWAPYAHCRSHPGTREDNAARGRGGWESVRMGLRLILTSYYIGLGTAALSFLGYVLLAMMMVASLQRRSSFAEMGVLYLCGLAAVGLAALAAVVLHVIGYGFCMGCPRGTSARPLAITVFALALASILLLLLGFLSGLCSPASSVFAGLAIMAMVLSVCVAAAEFIVSCFFLRSVALAVGQPALARTVVMFLIAWGCSVILLPLFNILLSGLAAVDLTHRDASPAAAVFILVLLINSIVSMALSIWFLVILHQVSAAVKRFLRRTALGLA